MNIKEQIRAEIERRMKIYGNPYGAGSLYDIRKKHALAGLLDYLDTLPEQPVLPGIVEDERVGIPGRDFIPVEWVDACEQYGKWKIVRTEQPVEGLEEEVDEYVKKQWDMLTSTDSTKSIVRRIARHFAEWGTEHLRDTTKMIDEGLEEAAEEYEHIEGHFYYPSVKDAFKAGAEWMKSKMPKWYKVEKDGMLDKPTQFILSAKEGYFFCTGDYISRDGYAIFVDELEKLPKEDEK